MNNVQIAIESTSGTIVGVYMNRDDAEAACANWEAVYPGMKCRVSNEPILTRFVARKVRINTPNTQHLYSLGTQKGTIEVEANNRAQAARIADRQGYIVNDCNMIG